MGSKSLTQGQIKEIMEMNKAMLTEFFTLTVDRLEAKIDRLTADNSALRVEIAEIRNGAKFCSDSFDDKVKIMEAEKTRAVKEMRDLELKLSEIEDRNRRNNLRFNGIPESADETWEETDKKLESFFSDKLGLERITIERSHRTGKRESGRNRTIVAKFLNYRDKVEVLNKFRDLKLWEENIFLNDDFSRKTLEIRKNLFAEAKERRKNNLYAKVEYKTLITEPRKNGASTSLEE